MILRISSFIVAALLLSACTSFLNKGETVTAEPVQMPIEAGERITTQPGDTVYSVSRRHNVSMRELIALNRLQPPYAVASGQPLLLPAKPLMTAPSAVAQAAAPQPSEAPMLAMAPVQSQPLPPQQPVVRGVTMYHQKVDKPLTVPKLDAVIYPSTEKDKMKDVAQQKVSQPDPTLAVPLPARARPSAKTPLTAKSKAVEKGRFIWPVQGTLISNFGGKGGGTRNDGVNISAPRGTPVGAAESGVVVYAGADIPGYGNVVILRHAGDYMTTYAHLERMFVAKDDTAAKGDVIGTVGTTGGLVTPQLHFEIRHRSDPLDPKKHLSAR
jgi:murein DD-endopeptidase MepM/ murein hydrolase activator NlpD